MGSDCESSAKKLLKEISKAPAPKQIGIGAAAGWVSGYVMMKVGSLARVDTSTPNSAQHGYLIWLIAPRVFDALAK